MRTYELVAQALHRLGTTTVFGVVGDGNMHWVAAFADLSGTRYVPAWHEAGAVGMADGWATAHADGSAAVGVATVTMGPGLAQAVGALTAAVRTRSRLLVISAEVSGAAPRHAQWADQAAWVQACGARYVTVDDPAAAERALRAGLLTAADGRPVVLAFADGVLDRPAPEPTAAVAGPDALGDTDPSTPIPDRALDQAVALLRSSSRPVLVLGRGAASALGPASTLAAAVGAPVATTVPAKGLAARIGGSTPVLGLAGMMAAPPTRATLASADVAVVVGAALDAYNTDGGAAFAQTHLIRIDRRAVDELWDPPARSTAHLTGDAGSLLSALADRVGPTGRPGPAAPPTHAELDAWLAAERDRVTALAATPTADGPNPWAVVAALDAALPEQAYLVVGIGHFWYFAVPHLSALPGRRFAFGHGLAMIGQALPQAIGAAVAAPGAPVIAIEGDGSLPMNLLELQTAVRLGVDLVVVVLDNQAYASEVHKLDWAGQDTATARFDDPIDLVAVAEALGATARRADDASDIAPALTELLASTGVRLLVARISANTLSEVYQRQHDEG